MAKKRKARRRPSVIHPVAAQELPETTSGRDTFPSQLHRFKPGESGNPSGRPPNAGSAVREMINSLCAKGVTTNDLKKILKQKGLSWALRTAALRMVRAAEHADIADFEDLFSGGKTIEQLRKEGVDTQLIKRFRLKTRTLPDGATSTTADLELHDRSGEDFDRILDRTDGRPRQSVDFTGTPGGASPAPPTIIVEIVGTPDSSAAHGSTGVPGTAAGRVDDDD